MEEQKQQEKSFYDRFLLRRKQMLFLIDLSRGKSPYDFWKSEKVTNFYVYKAINTYRKGKLLKTEKVGRTNKVTMTKKGKQLVELFEGLLEICK